jgi:hypothetical protein
MTFVVLASSFWLVWFPRDTNQPPAVLSFPTYELCRQTAYAYEPENSRWWSEEEWERRRRADRQRHRLEDQQQRVSWQREAQALGAAVLDNPEWVESVDNKNVWGTGGGYPFFSMVGILPIFERRFLGDCAPADNEDARP